MMKSKVLMLMNLKTYTKQNPTNILLIDVRENEEFSTSAIEGSISIPLKSFETERI